MTSKVHMYKVEMTCEGCSNAVTNVLNKNKGESNDKKDKGIQSFDVDLKEKLVSVQSTLDSNAILEIIQKTGKTVSYIGEKK